jgi:hypothetical protein
MPKITKRLVEAAEIRDKDYIIFDCEIPGFGIRILPSGKRSYLVQYRVGRKFRRMSLGLRDAADSVSSSLEQALPIHGSVWNPARTSG